jgi:hypothetical protein
MHSSHIPSPIEQPTKKGWYILIGGTWKPTDQLTYRSFVNTLEVR